MKLSKLAFSLLFLWISFSVYASKVEISIRTQTGKVYKANSRIVLENNEKNLVFTIDVKDTNIIQTEYCLVGLSEEWLELEGQKKIVVANLLGGEYNLKIRDKSSKIVIAQFPFRIKLLIWQENWFLPSFYLFSMLIVSMIAYLFFQYRLRQQLRTQIVRDTIARDLHDDIGSYLSSISILSQNVDNLILNNPEKARQSLTKIGETARQVMDTMGDIVWSINPTHDSMEQIVNRMKDFANELFFNQDIEINFQASDSLKKLNLTLERRRDFFLIYKESMTNIYKYAEAILVNVSLQYIDNQVFLKVEDNGKGFEMELLPKNRASGGNGLKNMKVRAEKLNGKLEITSKINQGTSIILTFEP